MASYKKILVYLQPPSSPSPVLARFTDCILTSLNLQAHHGLVNVELKDDKLILSHPSSSTTPPALLTHPPFCPAHCISPAEALALPMETQERGVDVGVVVLLETSDRSLLLTRRAQHMRTFPGTWVPPGGHVESGEMLLEAGLRELREETGLVLGTGSIIDSRVLALWESVYPYSLRMGVPKRHHIVTYYLVRSAENSQELQARLELDRSEVDAAMWLTPSLARLVAEGQEFPDCPSSVDVTVFDNDNKMCRASLSATVLTQQAPDSGKDVERVGTGTRYALQQWIALEGV